MSTRAGRLDDADDLVAGRGRRPVRRQVALGQVQVCAADAAAADAYPYLTGPGVRDVALDPPQRTLVDWARMFHHPGVHVVHDAPPVRRAPGSSDLPTTGRTAMPRSSSPVMVRAMPDAATDETQGP